MLKHGTQCVLLGGLLLSTACAFPSAKSQDGVHQARSPHQQSTQHYSSGELISWLYKAQIHLDLNEREQALQQLEKVEQYLADFSKKGRKQSDLLVELTYPSHGTLTKLYVPSMRGDERYAETESALSQLAQAEIVPLEYRLVTYRRQVAQMKLKQPLGGALAALKERKVKDDSRATIDAARELSPLFDVWAVRPYTGSAENRLEFHTAACEMLLQFHAYDAARDALKLAQKALADIRHQPHDLLMVEDYTIKLIQLDKAIGHKDPSFLTRIGRSLDQLVNGAE